MRAAGQLFERLVPPLPQTDAAGTPVPANMTRTEQVAVVAVGVLGFLVSVGIALSGQIEEGWQMAGANAGLVAVSVVLARMGKRLVAAFGLLLTAFIGVGLFLQANILMVAPHYGVAMWIMLKHNKVNREVALARRAAQRAAAGPGTRAAPTGRRSRKAAAAAASRPAPPPSKRYTPPKAKKKKRNPPAPTPE